VPVEEAKEFAKEKGLFFLETSALDSNNVEPAFLCLLSHIYMTVCKKHITADGHGPDWDKVNLGMGSTSVVYFWHFLCLSFNIFPSFAVEKKRMDNGRFGSKIK
jgi:hypothetical protein